MFDMQQVGARISRLRKEADLTQMEMANRLGISFQAVSNWERGVSMPDISKLGELADLLHVPIDQILGHSPAGQVVAAVLAVRPAEGAALQEIQEAAPLLRDDQVEGLLGQEGAAQLDAASVATVAPFLSQGFLDRYARGLLEKGEPLSALCPVAPFVSTSLLDKAAEEEVKRTGELKSVACVAPHLSAGLADRLAGEAYAKTGDFASFAPLAPFLSTQTMDGYAERAWRQGGINAIMPLAAFVSSGMMNRIAKEALKKEGLAGICPILPFIDQQILEDFLAESFSPWGTAPGEGPPTEAARGPGKEAAGEAPEAEAEKMQEEPSGRA
ncbi:MAG TPA: helix-turn-helix domain-containing protein [Firmicutes bacterium]|nr:helix-turn-helix domain-containing protein [Bacillota bacterium]